MQTVKAVFDQAAETYDRSRKQLVPCFDDFYGTALELIPAQPHDNLRVLDLGAGTGLLSSFIAESFPTASITLLDISQEMLDKARERFGGLVKRLEFIVGDYGEGIAGQFDVVVSALSIHHLSNDNKRRLFKNIHNALADGGIFINADQVLGPTPHIEQRYQETWLKEVRKRGVSETDLNAALKRMEADQMATLEEQLQWLRQAGFNPAHCWYQHHRFAVFSGEKCKSSS